MRFTIRELVLATLVVAMGVGWWLDRSQIAARHEVAISRAQKLQSALKRAKVQSVMRETEPKAEFGVDWESAWQPIP